MENIKKIGIGAVIIIALYFIYKKTKSKAQESGEEAGKSYKNETEREVLASDFKPSVQITENMTVTEKRIAEDKIAFEEEEYKQLLAKRTEYYNLTKKSGAGLSYETLVARIDDYNKTANLLTEYITLTGDDNANIEKLEYDTYDEVMNLINSYKKKQKDLFDNAVKNYKEITNSEPPVDCKTAEQVNAALSTWSAKKRELDALNEARSAWDKRRRELIDLSYNFVANLDQRGARACKDNLMKSIFPAIVNLSDRDFVFFIDTTYSAYANRKIDLFGFVFADIKNHPIIFFRENAAFCANVEQRVNDMKNKGLWKAADQYGNY